MAEVPSQPPDDRHTGSDHHNTSGTDVSAQAAEGADICRYFLQGRCHFGDRCRLLHGSHSESERVAEKEQPARQEAEKEAKGKKNMRKHKKAHKERNPAKEMEKPEAPRKPRMRPAEDVISRILWDPSLDPADFAVGYLDRFLGVLERPFSEFSWDKDLCNCDYTEELALPQHRIKYFCYRGSRVWDRESRKDGVFGSTGGALEPPFRLEGDDLESDQQTQQPPNTQTDDPAEDKSSNVQTEVEEVPGDHCEEDGVAQLTIGRTQREADGACGAGGQQKASWEKETLQVRVPCDQVQPGPLRRGQPTHFIAIRADSPALLCEVQRLREEITSLFPLSAPHWVAMGTLHITLSLLVLRDPQEEQEACEVLRVISRERQLAPAHLSWGAHFGDFRGRVLYLTPQPQACLHTLSAPLQEEFKQRGWLHHDSFSPQYHLTLAKMKGSRCATLFQGVSRQVHVGQLGNLRVDKLYLCARHRPCQEDGFYETVCTVSLRDRGVESGTGS